MGLWQICEGDKRVSRDGAKGGMKSEKRKQMVGSGGSEEEEWLEDSPNCD